MENKVRTEEELKSDIQKFQALAGEFSFKVACMQKDIERFHVARFNAQKELENLSMKKEELPPEEFQGEKINDRTDEHPA